MSNRYATASKNRAAKAGTATKKKSEKRRPLDDYETPEPITRYLAPAKFNGPIFECAAGSGRMAKVLKKLYPKSSLVSADIKRGADFLKRTATFKGNIITNPPYKGGLADKFLHKALELADGKVAMLMQGGFLFGDRRNRSLYANVKPEMVIIVPERVLFFNGESEKTIEGQFYNNVWIVFPDKKTRTKGGYETKIIWPVPPEKAPAVKRGGRKPKPEFDFG